MEKTKQKLIDTFFESYVKRDIEGIKQVMSENVTWTFLGQNKVAGIKTGIDQVIGFFDQMGKIMKDSKPTVDKLIVAENETYLIECQHIKTNRIDSLNIEHNVTVLWTFENGKIISGQHFFADPESVNIYFNSVPLPAGDVPDFVPVIVEQTFDAPINTVWKAITDENEMKKWYFEAMKAFKPEVGFETEFNVHENGIDYLHKWKVTAVEFEKKITYIWTFGGFTGEWEVTFELSRENDKTKLILTDVGIENFPQDNPDFSRESCTEGWNYFIRQRLKEFVDNEI